MVAPKEPLLVMPFGQGPKFKPLPSAARKRALTTITELRRWFINLPGETYANEILVQPTGAWPAVNLAPPAPLAEVLRFTLPTPEPVSLVLHAWVDEDTALVGDRFRRQLRMIAELEHVGLAALEQLNGRFIVEWGVGKARNWTYCDLAPGSLQIPNANWVSVSAWTRTLPARVAATAQVGTVHAPADCTWSFLLADTNPNLSGRFPPPYARNLTGYFAAQGLAGEGKVILSDFLNNFMEWLMRSAVTPNPVVIPYAPVSVPIAGSVFFIGNQIVNAGTAAAFCTSVVTVRV